MENGIKFFTLWLWLPLVGIYFFSKKHNIFSADKDDIFFSVGVFIIGVWSIEWYDLSKLCWNYMESNFPVIDDPFAIAGYIATYIRLIVLLLEVLILIIGMAFFLRILAKITGVFRTERLLDPHCSGYSSIEMQLKFNKVKELIKLAKEQERAIYQGVLYDIKASIVILNFKCPIIYYENIETHIIKPQAPQVVYKCLYWSASVGYFLYMMYDSNKIKIETLSDIEAQKLIKNHTK